MGYEIGIGVGLSVIAFIFAYLSINLYKENKFIRLFFLLLSLWSITMTLSVLEEIANANSITAIENMLEAMTVSMISISTLFTFLVALFGAIAIINTLRGKKAGDYDDYDDTDEKGGLFI